MLVCLYVYMLAKISFFVKRNQEDVILLIGVILISLLSFAMGYIVAQQQGKEPVRIEGAGYEPESSLEAK